MCYQMEASSCGQRNPPRPQCPETISENGVHLFSQKNDKLYLAMIAMYLLFLKNKTITKTLKEQSPNIQRHLK